MKLSKERKFFTIVLIFYWVGIFFATHISVPGWTREMGVSDKIMHFVAYLVLMLLLWLSTSFEKKADWGKIRTWALMGIVLIYALFDEASQYFIEGRSADLHDLLTNFLGAGVAMVLVTILTGWHAATILFVICPIFLPALVRSKLIAQGSVVEIAAYATAFVIITIVWIQYLSSIYKLSIKELKHIAAFLAGPAGAAAMVKIYAVFTNKPMGKTAILSTVTAIILTLIVWFLTAAKKTVA
jgi:hypothetical protein